MSALSTIIRPYSSFDKERIRNICAETGLWGKPIESLFDDRKLFAKLIVDSYLHLEPEHALVVDSKEGVVGYMIGSVNKSFKLKQNLFHIKNGLTLFAKSISGAYEHHKPSKEFVKWAYKKAPSETPKTPKIPAHLHLNLLPKYQGNNLGERLLHRFEEMVLSAGQNQYYAEVFSSESRREEELYKRLGFEIFDKKPSTMFGNNFSENVYCMCITKKIKK